MNGILLAIPLGICIAFAVWLAWYYRRRRFDQMLDIVFLRVLLPRKDSEADEKRETTRDFKEQISLMEQLLVGFRSLSEGGFLNRFFGNTSLSLEVVSHA
jgi:hypothetical protein